MKRPAVLLAVVFAFALAAMVVRSQLRKRQLSEQGAAVEPAAMAATYHRGAPPCVRYPPAPTDPVTAYAATAKRLDEAGVDSDQLADLVGHFVTTHREREQQHHDQDSVEEYLAQLAAQQRDPLEKLSFWLQRDLLRDKLQAIVGDASGSLAEHERRGQERWAKLSPAQQRVLSEVDEATPLHLEVSGLVKVLDHLKPATTRRRAKALAERAKAARAQRPEFPVRLEDLSLTDAQRLDAWSQAFTLSAVGSTIEVRSPGADDADEGDDIVESVTDEAAAPTGVDPCGALGSTFVLKRSELPTRLEPGTRVVPAVKEGKPVGLKVFGLTHGSTGEKAGLCNGDVVLFVDGLDVSSPDKALAAWRKVKDARRVVLTVERRGVEGELTVELR